MTAPRKTLRLDDKCPMAALVQALLRAKGHMPGGNPKMDNHWGPNCVSALQSFKEETRGLEIPILDELLTDGEVGRMTLLAFTIRWGVNLDHLPDAYWPQVEEA